jgi:hypothetical protein
MREHVLPEVLELLKPSRLLWTHPRGPASLMGVAGWPDLFIGSPRGLIARECKPNSGVNLSPAQQRWRWVMKAAGIDYDIWTQDSLDNGIVQRELEALR